MCGHPSGLNQSVSSRSSAPLPAEIIPSFPSALLYRGSLFATAPARLFTRLRVCKHWWTPGETWGEVFSLNVDILWINSAHLETTLGKTEWIIREIFDPNKWKNDAILFYICTYILIFFKKCNFLCLSWNYEFLCCYTWSRGSQSMRCWPWLSLKYFLRPFPSAPH